MVEVERQLICRLRCLGVPRSFSGEIEWENTTSTDVELRVCGGLLRYVDLSVEDESGPVPCSCRVCDYCAPATDVSVVKFRPGECLKWSWFPLLMTIHHCRWHPGRFLVEAVFECDGIHAVSNKVEVVLGPEDRVKV